MKILFLDIDGVVNCDKTVQTHGSWLGIDPYMSLLVNRICEATGAKVVLSSTWRLDESSRDEVRNRVINFVDVTPDFPRAMRGYEIKKWLDSHSAIDKYAILDDTDDMLPEQQDSFFQTSFKVGLTDEIARDVINHLNS